MLGQRPLRSQNGAGVLLDRDRLSGQGRFLSTQSIGLDQPAVGRDLVPGLELDAVAEHEIAGRHAAQHALANYLGRGGREAPQQRKRASRTLFLEETDGPVEEHDCQDDEGVDPFPHQAGDEGGRQQDPDHQLLELGEKPQPGGAAGSCCELVRAMASTELVDPTLAQPVLVLRIGAQQLDDGSSAQRVGWRVRRFTQSRSGEDDRRF